MKTLTVKNIEWKPTKDGSKQYMAVILTNGQKDSTKSIFDPEQQKVFQEAYYNNKTVNVEFEKNGQFWNVKSVEIVEGETPVSKLQNTKKDEILLSVAFKGAVELENYWYVRDENPHNARVLQNTEQLYDGLGAILGGNRIVLEAIKEGARIKKDA